MATQFFIQIFLWLVKILRKLFNIFRRNTKKSLYKFLPNQRHSFEEISNVYIKHLDWSKISSTTKLQLYANYKQATNGDNSTKKPKGYFWSKKYQQWSAWKKLSGTNRKDAEMQYVQLYYSQRSKQHSPLRKNMFNSILDFPGRAQVKKQGLFAQYFDKSFSGIFLDQLPESMVDEYLDTHVHKYHNVAKGNTLTNLKAEELPRTICDSEFFESLVNTLYARGIAALNSIQNNQIYIKLFNIEHNNNENYYYICDTTIIRGFQIQEEDGFWMSPSIVLLSKTEVIAIAAESLNHIEKFPPPPFQYTIQNMTVLYPTDGLAWEMAKLHTFANLASISTMGFHPIQHFTLMDPIAISNIILNNCNSVFSRIISEHTYLQVQVNSNVLFSVHSVTNNSKMPYYPWNIRPTEEFGILNIFRLIVEGWEGHPIYRGEPNLFDEAPTLIGGYGRLLCKAKEIVKEFVNAWFDYFAQDLDEIKFTRAFLMEFWKRLPEICFLNSILQNSSSWNTEQMMEFMKQILIYVIYTPIEHSVDHRFLQKSFFHETCHQIMRLPIPFHDRSVDPIHINNYIKNINSLTDRAKHVFCQYFSFHHYPSKTLSNLFGDDGGYWNNTIPKEHLQLENLNRIQEIYLRKLAALFSSKDSPMSWLNIGTSIQS